MQTNCQHCVEAKDLMVESLFSLALGRRIKKSGITLPHRVQGHTTNTGIAIAITAVTTIILYSVMKLK